MAAKHVPPSISEKAFSCPHCGAYTSHSWFNGLARRTEKDGAPGIWTKEGLENIRKDATFPTERKQEFLDYLERVVSGEIFLAEKTTDTYALSVNNLNFSHCFVCSKIGIWVYDRLIYPPAKSGPESNADLPADVLRDYEEARSIVGLSPRGAAALLRLAIQKLCKELGESGQHLDSDIAGLVKKGLNPLVQKSLDIVRVIGNESVHPGALDMRDNTDTALKLFGLVNLIAEQMISTPKHIGTLYESLPSEKRQAIEQRDKPKK